MTQDGFLEQRSRSPGSLAIVIALHAAGITALMLAKSEYVTDTLKPFIVKSIKETPPPPPEKPQPQVKPETRQKTAIDQVKPIVPIEKPTDIVLQKLPDFPMIPDPRPGGDVISDVVPTPPVEPKPIPVPDPVRKEAQLLASSELQPPYPASEQRAGNEGSVTIRIHIGPDGRVTSVEKVRGGNDAFFRATEQQALRHWRFRPATVDGRPVESVKVMTVHFELTA